VNPIYIFSVTNGTTDKPAILFFVGVKPVNRVSFDRRASGVFLMDSYAEYIE
jgi:hypothetical protein